MPGQLQGWEARRAPGSAHAAAAPAPPAALQIRSLQTPGSASPLLFISFEDLRLQRQKVQRQGPVADFKVVLPCMAAEVLLSVVLILLEKH